MKSVNFFGVVDLIPYWTTVFHNKKNIQQYVELSKVVKLASQWLLASLFSRLQCFVTFVVVFSKCWWWDWDQKKFFLCVTSHFLCWDNHIAVYLLPLWIVAVQLVCCSILLLLEAFSISALRKSFLLRKPQNLWNAK